MKTSQQIRQEFIDFFVQKHGHTFVPSSPVVPLDDPTLLFTNAGMNQFKPIFLGQEKRAYTRAANTQKCIRAGGKHNDLDDVGRSRRHHTFFEMLGNWSFGDYFKKEAIAWSWELLTKVWGLDPTRLHVTVHAGDASIGVARDDEAANLWREIGVPDDHIHYGNTKDNFWEMGETGPCGPCTEIFVDRTPDKTGGPTVLSGEDPRVMEIWNNVFIQYNRNADRSLTPLPAKHVDTGMGLERIIQVLQGKGDNYAIDLFDPFWAKLKALSGITYVGLYPPTNAADPEAENANPQLRHDIAFRVIADHIRCLTFALTDGAVPDKEGRGYVLRRILRRAVFWGRQHLGIEQPFLHELVQVVVGAMGEAFPELKRDPARVAGIIKDEEVSFGKTWTRGIDLFGEAAERAKKTISAEDAFKLHDTYGFPIDLTRIMAEERGMAVDVLGFEKLMEEAKKRSRDGGKDGDTRLFDLAPDALATLQKKSIATTDDSAKYGTATIAAKIAGIWDGSKLIDQTHGAEAAEQGVAVVLDKTNFYAEMGGQVGDTGELRTSSALLDVTTTRVAGGYVLHVGRTVEGHLKVGDQVTATVAPRRALTQKNHTTTHLANWALREVLGDDVQQKGSLVDPEKLRFDFSHGKAVSDEELGKVETLVSQGIEKKFPIYAEEARQELALKINGLRAVFGEKYPPLVRVVSVGAPVADLLKDPANPKWREFSIEFCGGTHLANSAEAEGFVITAEESVSKGIRRIVGLTGEAAKQSQKLASDLRDAVERARAVAEPEIPAAIAGIQKQLQTPGLPLREKRRGQAAVLELQAKFKSFEKAKAKHPGGVGDVGAAADKLLAEATDFGGGKLIVGVVEGASDDLLRGISDSLRKRLPSHAILLASTAEAKVGLLTVVSDDLIAKGLKAGDWIRDVAKVVGGGGGGRPQMAQAGGKDPSKIGEALETARRFAGASLK